MDRSASLAYLTITILADTMHIFSLTNAKFAIVIMNSGVNRHRVGRHHNSRRHNIILFIGDSNCMSSDLLGHDRHFEVETIQLQLSEIIHDAYVNFVALCGTIFAF